MKKIKTKKKNKFKSISIEELEKKLKTTKSLHRLMIGIWVFGLISYIYLTIIENYEISGALIVIAICLIGGMDSNYKELKAIKNELNTRRE